MKTTARVVLWVGFVLGVLSATSTTVRGLTTNDGYLMAEPQLYISAYQRTDDGLSLKFFQLYNNSDEPIDLAQWSVYFGEVKPENKLDFSASRHGLLEPNTHVVVSLPGVVRGATYQFVQSPTLAATPDKATMTIVPPSDSQLRNVMYDIKYTKVTSTKNAYYEIWQRNQTTTGYSATSSSFTAIPAVSTIEPHYADSLDVFDNGLYEIPAAPALRVVEIYSFASECSPFDTSVLCGDYVKLKVDDPSIDLSQYTLRSDSNSSSRTISNTFSLAGLAPNDHGYITVHRTDDNGRISLTNSGGYVWLEDIYGLARYQSTSTAYLGASSDQQGWAYALSDDTWQWTATPEPLADNVITAPITTPEIKPCPAGQYRNPETNRCRAIEEAVNALATCPEGQYRNPETNRCKSAASAVASLVPCGEGQERNPETNRCRSIAGALAELIPCDEGYERNPATNRCRKVAGASTVVPSLTEPAETGSSQNVNIFTNPYAIAAVVALGGIGYGVYEWRSEITGGFKKLAVKLGKK